MNKEKKKLKCGLFLSYDFTEEELNEQIKHMKEGNIPAKLNIVMHNQAVLLGKLEEIINKFDKLKK